MAWGALSQPWQGQLPGPSWRAWGLVVVEAQSPGLGAEEGGPFQAEGVAEEGPCPAVEEVGVEDQSRAGEEGVVAQNLVVGEEEEAVVGDKVHVRVRAGEVVVAEEQRLPVKVVVAAEVVVGVEVGVQILEVEELSCSVASAGTCSRQSSL